MFILYDLIFLIVAIIYLPVYLCRKKFHAGFLLRLGLLPHNLQLDNSIWIHAVSVGEMMAVKGLVVQLRSAYPDKKLVISTVTATGNKIAKDIAKATDFVTYLPLDFSFIVRSVMNRIKPSLFVIVETEIWPNLITCLHKMSIPQVVVNGRISDRSLRGYLMVKFLLARILNRINFFCVQTQKDAQGFKRLGLRPDKVKVTGNMKFDSSDYTDYSRLSRDPDKSEKKDFTDLKLQLDIKAQGKLWVAGSTHPPEEALILEAYKNLLKDYPGLRLLIAPRHPERAKQVSRVVAGFGFFPILVSNMAKSDAPAVFILDTIGSLLDFYRLADIVFVGGSLVKKGGHNILEPAALGKPILFGPQMFNFRDIADLFLENEAAICVHSGAQLTEAIADLLKDPLQTEELGEKAIQLILQNQGATAQTLNCIVAAFPPQRSVVLPQ